MNKENKLLIIVGPTAAGKTSLGIKLANKYNGEIVSADSRQIYKYMDIGTGKDLQSDLRFKIQDLRFKNNNNCNIGYYKVNGVRVWLYDVIEPDQRFSAVDYANLAEEVIKNIYKRGKLPIVVGGTGFYIKTLIEGVGTSGIKADWNLREIHNNLTTDQLVSKLKILNRKKWESMNNSDRNNPRRLIRAIEIAKLSKQINERTIKQVSPKYNVLLIGISTTLDKLYKRIDNRVDSRAQAGIIEEIKKIIKKGHKWSDPGFNAIGYKEWQDYFSNKSPKEKVIQKWKYDEHKYARRQLTWFRKQKDIIWFDISNLSYTNKIVEKTQKWYDKK